MAWFHPRTLLDKIFEVGILLKGIDGVFEILGGLLLVLVRPSAIDSSVRFLTQHELSQDPHDFIANHLLTYVHDLTTGGRLFAAAFLLTHGLIKIVLVVGLLRGYKWAYPFAFVALGAFIVYQLYKIALQPTLGMIFLTALDGAIVWLTWREYKKLYPQGFNPQ